MQIYEWEPPTVSHHPDKFVGHSSHCGSGDMFVICQLASYNHLFKGLYNFMSGRPS